MGRRKKVTDREMIHGARECFLKFGPQVSTAVIAECVGISQAAIFKRFATKEELMIAALAPPVKPPWIEVLNSGPDDRPLSVQLTEIMILINGHIEKVFPRIHMLHMSGLSHDKIHKDEKYPPVAFMVQSLSSWLKRAQKKGMVRKLNTNSLAITLIGAIHSRAFIQHVTEGQIMRISGRTHIQNIVENLLSGIVPKGEGK